MHENIVADKSKKFAVRIVKLRKYLYDSCNERILSSQICRSGTSIGANIREANRAQSTADFLAKLSIALKEADETAYWLELLHETGFIPDGDSYQSLYTDCEELIRILVASIKTAKAN